MSAIDCLQRLSNTSLIGINLKYCLVNEKKLPYKIDGTLAKPNDIADFVELDEILLCSELENYAGIGISIQASKVCAIDVDKCFSNANDFRSIDIRGRDIYDRFKEFSYSEFSFSGTGLRILFNASLIENYSQNYYIKNEKAKIEYYQPSSSFRYVTLTGNVLSDNFSHCEDEILKRFLDDYMKKTESVKNPVSVKDYEKKTFEQLWPRVKYLYLKNSLFQNLWFGKAPGSGKDESERDFQILSCLYENVTQDKMNIKEIFEVSPYFKSKDQKHINKWEYQENRYFNYIYDQIKKAHD